MVAELKGNAIVEVVSRQRHFDDEDGEVTRAERTIGCDCGGSGESILSGSGSQQRGDCLESESRNSAAPRDRLST